MIPKEPEPTRFLELPQISEKTSSKQLVIWSKQRWPSDARNRVAADIVKNGKELLAESNIDWKLVLGNIRIVQLDSPYYGEAAIAKRDAPLIGALAVSGSMAMHDPSIVYLSVKLLANRVKTGEEFEDFKRSLRKSAVDYGQKVLSLADRHMESLDFLLEVENRGMHRDIINKILSLLGHGDIDDAHKIVKSRDDLVRRRE